jgi:cytochrome c553
MIRTFKPQWTLALAALALAGFSAAPAVLAAPAPTMHGKKMAAKTVYVCNTCHAYYTPAMAKKLKYKDDMGHTLVKSAKVPAGYLDASKIKM